jgi:hypothetical protein
MTQDKHTEINYYYYTHAYRMMKEAKYLKKKKEEKKKLVLGVGIQRKYLRTMHKALGVIPSTTKINK